MNQTRSQSQPPPLASAMWQPDKRESWVSAPKKQSTTVETFAILDEPITPRTPSDAIYRIIALGTPPPTPKTSRKRAVSEARRDCDCPCCQAKRLN